MCTYNGVRFLDDQLASLAAQQRKPDELVICDDCSTDETVVTLRQFAARAPFPVHIHQNANRLRSTKNFERAISLCEGDIIALCDQDDIWDSRKISLTEECFLKNSNVDLVFTDAEVVDEAANPVGYNLWPTLKFDTPLQRRIKSNDAFALLSEKQIVTGATMAFRAKYRDLVLPIPLDIPLIHDGWIALMISLVGDVDIIERPMIKYRQHQSQQLGAPTNDPSEVPTGIIERAKRPNSFAEEIKKLEAAYERILLHRKQFEPKHEEYLEHRLRHMQKRVEMSHGKFLGIPLALGELVRGRYHRYSNGFYSFAKDVFQSEK
jgi:glycosyltransferase involved in cell wall biosynthesis